MKEDTVYIADPKEFAMRYFSEFDDLMALATPAQWIECMRAFADQPSPKETPEAFLERKGWSRSNPQIGGALFVGVAELLKEYAAQPKEVDAVAFAEWASTEGWRYMKGLKRWATEINGNPTFKTTSELYTLFLNSKTKE